MLAEAWFKRLSGEKKAPTTLEQYRRILNRHAIPNLGNLAVRELTIGRCDRYQEAINDRYGAATAKMTRAVLSGMCGLACRHPDLRKRKGQGLFGFEPPSTNPPLWWSTAFGRSAFPQVSRRVETPIGRSEAC